MDSIMVFLDETKRKRYKTPHYGLVNELRV